MNLSFRLAKPEDLNQTKKSKTKKTESKSRERKSTECKSKERKSKERKSTGHKRPKQETQKSTKIIRTVKNTASSDAQLISNYSSDLSGHGKIKTPRFEFASTDLMVSMNNSTNSPYSTGYSNNLTKDLSERSSNDSNEEHFGDLNRISDAVSNHTSGSHSNQPAFSIIGLKVDEELDIRQAL